jgi:hypothetical protein
MFKGKADLIDPETKHVAATFNETEYEDGTTRATIRLAKPNYAARNTTLGGLRHRHRSADDFGWGERP